MYKVSLSFLILIITNCTNVFSQQLVFNNIRSESGIPASEVYHVIQDSKGYIWVFTEHGIVKHNGSTFISACMNIPLSERVAYAITEFEGKLYFVNSKAKVYQIQNDETLKASGIETITNEINFSNQVVSDLFFDKNAQLYISTFYKTFKTQSTNYSIKGNPSIRVKDDKKSNQKLHLIKKNNPKTNKIYIEIIDDSGKTISKLPDNNVEMERSKILQNSKGIYLTRQNRIECFKNNGDTIKYVFSSGIICFEQSANNHFWIGLSFGGLIELDENLNFINHYLKDVTVSSILFDNQFGLWVSTIEKGIYYCKNTNYLSYSNIPNLMDGISFIKVLDGKLFIGTVSGKLFVQENNNIRQIDLNGNNYFLTDIIAFDGHYYLGSKKSVFILDLDLKSFKILNGKANSYGFEKTTENELIFITGSSILRKKKNEKSIDLFVIKQKPRCIIKRPNNELLVSTQKGCFIYNSTLKCPSYLFRLKEKNISKFKTDKNFNTWICTKDDGLYQLSSQNKLKHIKHLPSNVINDILFSSNGFVFLSTNKGVYVNKYTNLGKKSKWILLLEEEIVSVEIYNNILFIGSKSGLTKLNLTSIFKKINYQFHLKSIEIEGLILPPKTFETDYTHTNINFNFDLLAYQFSEKKIRYQLIGNTSFKGEVSGMQLQLQNLIPGKYTLTVYPQLNEKNVTQEKITCSFYIKPAFWQTTTFRLISVLLIICLIVFISSVFFYRKRIKQERKNAIEKQLVEYRLTALKAQINPHFMSNSLVSIQQLVLTEQIDKASLYIAKFGQLIRYLLNYSDQSVSNLKKEISMIELYIELEQLRFENKFNLELIIDPSLRIEEIYIPALITQPLIENAIWHGLLQLKPEQKPQLVLRFELFNDEFIISIEDNGTNRFKQIDSETNESRKSKGTSLIRQRLASLNELYETSGAHIDFKEIFNSSNEKTGTHVTITFTSKILNKLNPTYD